MQHALSHTPLHPNLVERNCKLCETKSRIACSEHVGRMGDNITQGSEDTEVKTRLEDQWMGGRHHNENETGRVSLRWINLAEDRNMWCALVTMVMKRRVP